MSKIKKNILNEFRHFSGMITESDQSSMLVSSILPGIQNSAASLEDAANELKNVAARLEKLDSLLKQDPESLHLESESQFLHSKLRGILHKVLSVEIPVRQALTKLDSI